MEATDNRDVDFLSEQKKGIVKEYDMLRSQIDNAIERMDKYYIQAVVALLVTFFFQRGVSVFFIAIGLIVALALQLKILECKNMVSYNAAYLMVFIENPEMGLMYETRVQKLRMRVWDKKKKKGKKDNIFVSSLKRLKSIIGKLGYRIKNALIGAFALVVVASYFSNNKIVSTVFHLNSDAILNGNKSLIKFVVLSLLALANVVFAIHLCVDKKKPQEFAKAWQEIKLNE